MMEAIISGQAGCFVLLEKQPLFCDLDSPADAFPVSLDELSYIFRSCSDVARVSVNTFDQAKESCELAWQKDRALRFALMLLEVDDDLENRLEYAQCLDGLLRRSEVANHIRERLLISPIPEQLLSITLDVLREFPNAGNLFAKILELQPFVRDVREKLMHALSQVKGDAERKHLLDAFEGSEAIATFVLSLATAQPVDFFALKLMRRLRPLEHSQTVIQQWMNLSRSTRRRKELSSLPEEDDVEEQNEAPNGKSSRKAFESVMRQQNAILGRLRSGDLNGARRYVIELIASQSAHSTAEQLGKSLSRLAHQAKEIGAAALQVEWAQLAVNHSPSDPLTFSHLADAYITTYQFSKAGETLNQLHALAGDNFSSEFGFARILRAQGQFEQARTAFLTICERYPYDENVSHARAAAAETLREMGRYEDALAEYTRLTEVYPLEGALWSGRAAVLMDLGRMAEAARTFNIAEKHDSGHIARSGRAAAHRHAGNFGESLKLYSDLIREFPHDYAVLNGRAEVYRDQGKYENALRDYERARNIAPFHPAPLFGAVKTLRDLRRYNKALELLDGPGKEFPYFAPLAAIRGSILMREHRYSEALQTYDEISERFPLDFRSEKNRADALRRLGYSDEALNAYDSVLTKHPFYNSALLARASLLIELRRFDEARTILRAETPVTKFEWSKELLRALLLEGAGDLRSAEAVFAGGARRSPFYAIRRTFRAALARHMLLKNNISNARKIMEEEDSEVSNIIRLHTLAAAGRTKPAQQTLQNILAHTSEPRLIYLSNEIASRFRIIPRAAEKSREWIFEEERSVLLLTVA